jgi:ADP-ribose pyrophosphatase YjhB (NUDIX family)
MDLEILGQGDGFKVRAAAVAIRDGRVLLHFIKGGGDSDTVYCVLPGGGVDFGETARDAVARELREELSVDAGVGRLLFVAEQFFALTRRRWHQLAWYYEVTLPGDCEAVLRDSWDVTEPPYRTTFRWVPLADLDSAPLIPGFLRQALRDLPESPRHVVHIEPAT